LFGRSFRLVVCSQVGQGTIVTLRIPLRKPFGNFLESPGLVPPYVRGLALY